MIFIRDASSKWYGDRLTIRMGNTPTPIGRIPFPVVTICPTTKFSIQKFNYTDVNRALLKFDGNNSRTVTPKEYK